MRAAGIRQQPGFACQECRRRKARCDRVRPQCGFCAETGTPCVIVDKRPQRGPKKGQLSAMRSRIATLEQQLGKQMGYCEPNVVSMHTSPGSATSSDMMISDLEPDSHLKPSLDADGLPVQVTGLDERDFPCVTASAGSVISTTPEAHAPLPVWPDWQDIDNGLVSPSMMSLTLAEPIDLSHTSPTMMLGDLEISDLMQADLDQLYFDRVHPVCPMIHQRRYFAWVSQENPSPARACLRSAMRTMAAAMSAQFRGFGDALYAETRRLLEIHSRNQATEMPWLLSCDDKIPLEQIQAWLLLAHYEFMRMDEHQAMLTAGRAFRLVQMARLYDVDAPLGDASASPASIDSEPDESFAEMEEKRRTFWLAFSFDRFLCSRNEWPLTLQEEMICTRLPAPEIDFQNSQRVSVSFLPEAMAQSGPSTLSPFAECVVLATLHGRCMAHRRAATKKEPGSAAEAREFWTRHEWLAAAVEKRVTLLAQRSPSVTAAGVDRDPMLLFAHMLAHGAVVYLSSTVRRTPWQTVEHRLMTTAYERRASQAAAEMVRLAKAVPSLSCFKAHPFLPNPLACATAFLVAHADLSEGGNNDDVEHLLRVLRNLRDLNSLARDLSYQLETDCIQVASGPLMTAEC